MKVALSPESCQLPAMLGDKAGSVVVLVMVPEYMTVMAEAPFTPADPLPGLTETTLTTPAFFLWLATVPGLAAAAGVLCEEPCTATVMRPIAITAAAAAAVMMFPLP